MSDESSREPGHDARGPLLAEVSWEVCQQVGGIYTVLRSKVPAMVKSWGRRYCLVGPWNPQLSPAEFEETRLGGEIGAAVLALQQQGLTLLARQVTTFLDTRRRDRAQRHEDQLRAMALEVEREDPSLLYLRRCMDKLMLTVGRSYAEDEESGSFGWLSHPIMQALKIIENHAASNEPLRVSQLAGQCELSPGYFSREFRKAVGSSPSQYFQRRRIQHASWLLLHTRQSISEIAYSLGFADVSHFERVFHVRRMMTPLAYRQRFVERAR